MSCDQAFTSMVENREKYLKIIKKVTKTGQKCGDIIRSKHAFISHPKTFK